MNCLRNIREKESVEERREREEREEVEFLLVGRHDRDCCYG
jgi:hypothetical protein